MRLIDADAFLRDILTAGIGKTIVEYSESNIGYMIRERPTIDIVPQWISVKDGLPETGREVLVVSRGWGDRLLYVGERQKVDAQTSPLTGITSKASDWQLWGWSYLKEPQVTHWMPLPNAPEEAQNE